MVSVYLEGLLSNDCFSRRKNNHDQLSLDSFWSSFDESDREMLQQIYHDRLKSQVSRSDDEDDEVDEDDLVDNVNQNDVVDDDQDVEGEMLCLWIWESTYHCINLFIFIYSCFIYFYSILISY
ncbi:hypothetical protein RCL1_002610 [Eukaryota sp. TZLM3-RCL]